MELYQFNSNICPNCGFDAGLAAARDAAFGISLRDRYVLGRETARKKFFGRRIAWDELFGRKVLVQQYTPTHEDEGVRARALERYLRHAGQMIRVGDMPGLLGVQAVFEEAGSVFMVMDAPLGPSLIEFLGAGKDALTQHETDRLLADITRPLHKAAGLGICHGRIDMETCFCSPDGSYQLGCFTPLYFGDSGIGELSGKRTEFITKDIRELAFLAAQALVGCSRWESRNPQRMQAALREKAGKVRAPMLWRCISGEDGKPDSGDGLPGSYEEFMAPFGGLGRTFVGLPSSGNGIKGDGKPGADGSGGRFGPGRLIDLLRGGKAESTIEPEAPGVAGAPIWADAQGAEHASAGGMAPAGGIAPAGGMTQTMVGAPDAGMTPTGGIAPAGGDIFEDKATKKARLKREQSKAQRRLTEPDEESGIFGAIKGAVRGVWREMKHMKGNEIRRVALICVLAVLFFAAVVAVAGPLIRRSEAEKTYAKDAPGVQTFAQGGQRTTAAQAVAQVAQTTSAPVLWQPQVQSGGVDGSVMQVDNVDGNNQQMIDGDPALTQSGTDAGAGADSNPAVDAAQSQQAPGSAGEAPGTVADTAGAASGSTGTGQAATGGAGGLAGAGSGSGTGTGSPSAGGNAGATAGAGNQGDAQAGSGDGSQSGGQNPAVMDGTTGGDSQSATETRPVGVGGVNGGPGVSDIGDLGGGPGVPQASSLPDDSTQNVTTAIVAPTAAASDAASGGPAQGHLAEQAPTEITIPVVPTVPAAGSGSSGGGSGATGPPPAFITN
ncbi:MAG: hypothetical protein LBR77_02175 [Lachnospiraceae bacterium]|nr:hypothetical protein [Lachnospiraceae bacterium]